MLQVTVKRSEWNGNTLERVANSSLLCSDGKRCCLGFAAREAGVPDSKLQNLGYIHDINGYSGHPVPVSLLKLCNKSIEWQSEISEILTRVNDNRDDALHFATLADKEAFIIKHGREAGIEFTFID